MYVCLDFKYQRPREGGVPHMYVVCYSFLVLILKITCDEKEWRSRGHALCTLLQLSKS
jgi:hypothetical protein